MKKKIILIALVLLISMSSIFIFSKIQQKKLYASSGESISQGNEEDKSKDKNKEEMKEEKSGGETSKVEEVKKEPEKAKADDNKDKIQKETPKVENKTSTPPEKTSKDEKKDNVTPEKKEEPNIIVVNNITGEVLASGFVAIEGITAEQATLQLLQSKKISYMANSGYFSSIAGLKERSAGKASGWCYYVNDNKPGVGAAGYVLKKGDKLAWKFLKDGVNN